MKWQSLCVCAVSLAACGGAVVVAGSVAGAAPTTATSPAAGTSLAASLRFAGNTAHDAGALKRVVERAHAGTLDDARDAIEAHYFAHGHLDAKVSVGPPGDLVLQITEGTPYTLSGIDLVEAPAPPKGAPGVDGRPPALRKVEPGDRFDRDLLRAAIEAVRLRYVDAGYATANVTPISDVDKEHHTVRIKLEIERGPRSRRR